MTTTLASRFVLALVGPPGRLRTRSSQTLLALLIYVSFAGLQHLEVMLGLIEADVSWRLTAVYLSGAVCFYLLIRSGLSERIASDPSLTMPQAVFGLAMTVASYSVTGPARGGVTGLLVLILGFTMFELKPRQSRALAVFTFGLLGLAMTWRALNDPARYPPAVEIIHFMLAAILVGGISVLAQRMGSMRARLRSQKQKLEQALERISELATRDPLTGLVNRRHMTELLRLEQARLSRDPSTTVVAMVDIDFFKRINDAHGHHAGDRVLQRFAEVGREVLRANDVLARWGGEEFLLMLPGTSEAQALAVVERMRETLAQLRFDEIEPGLRVTFSAGLSAFDDAITPDLSIARADLAMYRAKSLGRNRTVMA